MNRRLNLRLRRISRFARIVGLNALLLAPSAWADVSDVSPTGFTSTHRQEVQASAATVWQAITQLPQWWSDQHTWSGKAANMQLELQAGGCWCERWGNGQSVMHGQVVLVQPGRLVRLNAALGPLQELGVNGVLTLITAEQEGKTVLRMTYRVSGAPQAGLEKLAPVVDRVMGEQYQRLKRMAETGQAQ